MTVLRDKTEFKPRWLGVSMYDRGRSIAVSTLFYRTGPLHWFSLEYEKQTGFIVRLEQNNRVDAFTSEDNR